MGLKKSSTVIASVAFGEYWDSNFIVFEDGSWAYQNIPNGLVDVIKRRQERCDLSCVSLAPDGEYYMSAQNGRAWWGGNFKESRALRWKVPGQLYFPGLWRRRRLSSSLQLVCLTFFDTTSRIVLLAV